VLKETVSGGVTLPTGVTRSFQSVNYPARYVRHQNYLGHLHEVTSSSTAQTKQDATFTVVRGLADANAYSFTGADGRYLRHYDQRLRLDANAGSSVFAQDATFIARPGSVSGSIRLESYNFPGRYIRHRDWELWSDLHQSSDLFRADSSFRAVSPWA
jgi:hypothetical protein